MWQLIACAVGLSLPMLAAAAQLNVQVLSPAAEPLGDVVVYLEKTDGAPVASQAQPMPVAAQSRNVEVLQHDKRFVPYVSVLHRNDKVVFRNSDDITHHIYSVTGPSRFSFKLRAAETHTVDDFSATGVIAMGCNIHDWMSGYMFITDAAYFAQSASDGWAHIANVPPGSYRVLVWHPQLRETVMPLPIDKLDADRDVQIKLTRARADVPRQKALDDFDFLEGY